MALRTQSLDQLAIHISGVLRIQVLIIEYTNKVVTIWSPNNFIIFVQCNGPLLLLWSTFLQLSVNFELIKLVMVTS